MKPGQEGTAKPWQTGSWRNYPKLAILSICGAVIAMALGFVTLYLADESPVDSWTLGPTVYLSIIVTLANAMLRFAFSEGADLFWWSRLLSPKSSPTLGELHTVWSLKHSASSLVKFQRKQGQMHLQLRLTVLLVLLLAVNGPLLQRAITVDITTKSFTRNSVPLPIRREPMWNLTSKKISEEAYRLYKDIAPPLQDEVAELFTELRQQQPMILNYAGCSSNATCTTTVVVAGFDWDCQDTEVPVVGAKTILPAPYFPWLDSMMRCVWTGFGEDKSLIQPYTDNSLGEEMEKNDLNEYCGFLETEFQLAMEIVPNFSRDLSDFSSDSWKDPQLPPNMMAYYNYVRLESSSDTLRHRECIFSTSFIELQIQIQDERTVTILDPSFIYGDTHRISTGGANIVESIPKALQARSDDAGQQEIMGIFHILANMYGGSIMYDTAFRNNLAEGPVRQYIDQSTIDIRDIDNDPILSDGERINSGEAYTFACIDPLADVINTLNEVSLRYALKSIPSTPARLEEMDAMYTEVLDHYSAEDLRNRVLPLMETEFIKEQVVDIHEERTIPVYLVHYVYAGVATGLSYITSLLILLLLRGVFSSHGRVFSMSPLEIAKAFNAPILDDAASNLTGKQLATVANISDRHVAYGEIKTRRSQEAPSPLISVEMGHLSQPNEQHETNGKSLVATTNNDADIVEGDVFLPDADDSTSLGIDVSGKVTTPCNKRSYA